MNGSTSFRPRMAVLLLAAALAAGCGGDKPEALVASAKDYLARNDSKAAVIQLKNALQQDPDLAEARYLLGVALLRAEDIPAAQKELRKARELKYPPEQVDPPLAHATALLQQFQKVVDEFASSTARNPEGMAELQTALGQAYAGLGKVDLARKAFAAALSADPRNGPALVADARLKAQTGDVAGALAQADLTVAALPALADAWMLKGDIALYQREFDAAASAYRKTIEARRDYLPAHAALVGLLTREGKAEEAATALATMKAVAPRDPQTLYFTAVTRAQAGDYKSARDAIQQQLQTLPDNVPGMLLAGAIDYELGAYAQAEAGLLKILQRAPEQSHARKLLIATYVKEGQPAKALDVLKPVLGGIGKDAAMLNVAGEVYLQAGEPATAARFFERSAALDPTGTRPRTGLALTRLAMGETDRGVRELEAAAAADTETRPDLALIATSLQQRQFDKALAAIDALDTKRPNMPMTSNLRGLALLGKNDNAGARKSFERALAIDPDFFPALANLSRLDIAEKKPAVAQRRLEDAIARKPANSQAMMALASMREHDKAPSEEMVALLNKAVAARPADIAPRVALMEYFLRIRAPKRAVVAGEEALVAIPGRPEILEALGVAQQAAGDVNQAMANFKRWSEAAPGSPSPHLRIAELQAQQKDLDGAVQSLRKALAIKPDLVMAQRGLINLDLGKDRLREALAIAHNVQKQRPTESTGYLLEGDIYASRKQWAEAVAAYRAGLKLAKSTEVAVKLEATLIAGGGSRAEADAFAATWLKQNPDDARFRFFVAQTASVAKNYVAAAKHYEALVADDPENPVFLNNLAWVAGKRNDPRAVEYAEKANKLAPNQAAFMDTLGTLLVEKGDAARGVQWLRKAVELDPAAAAVRLNLAKGLVKVGDKDAARKELDALDKLGDKFADQDEVARVRKSL